LVVVCREGERQVGIAVSHVLDVAAGTELFEAGTRQRAEGATLLKEHLTEIIDLSEVAPLPAASLSPLHVDSFAEAIQ
jgi:two-component system chemotaxis sensor kinase CheA